MSSKATTPTDLDDIDALLTLPVRPGPKECHTCWAIRHVDEAERDRLAAVVARTDIPPDKVRPLFAKRLDGWAPGETTITRHRSKCLAS